MFSPKSSPSSNNASNILTVVKDGVSSQETASSQISDRSDGSKSRKHPSVTPNTFRRFFTPRSSLKKRKFNSSARHALRDITAPSNNRARGTPRRRLTSADPFPDIAIDTSENALTSSPGQSKKRKPPHLSGRDFDALITSKRRRNLPTSVDQNEDEEKHQQPSSGISEDEDQSSRTEVDQSLQTQSVKRRSACSLISRALQRSIGTIPHRRTALNAGSWQYETRDFFCEPSDLHVCSNHTTSERVMPFCTASCNTNSLVAIGDEDGGVRLLESAKSGKPSFSESYLTFRPHTNAILDLAFSSDDLLLASASGDQTAQVIDMPTRRVVSKIAGHSSSVKQIRFQPGQGSNNVLATSSRDGSVQIWDLRCRGYEAPVHQVHVSLEANSDEGQQNGMAQGKPTWARAINSFSGAHVDVRPNAGPQTRSKLQAAVTANLNSKSENIGRRSDISITALAFLPAGREHLFLTASEANACIKLWDLRSTHRPRRGKHSPISTTRQPESHDRYRQFGINSLTLSGDSGRFYTLCRDNTIYAYSTNHLVLGHAPELSLPAERPRGSGDVGKDGLGPIYGFRHPNLYATTFFVKTSLREAQGDKSEILAVGSSDQCAVLFPTDESYLRRGRCNLANDRATHRDTSSPELAGNDSSTPAGRRTLSRSSSGIGASSRLDDTIPIYGHGSALIRGHDREVTSVSWTSEGELVTVGDDSSARCWREGPQARELRMCGEQGGRRWQSGWADIDEDDPAH